MKRIALIAITVALLAGTAHADLVNRVMWFLAENSNTTASAYNGFTLQNDGHGDYIKTWTVPGIPKPEIEDLPDEGPADAWAAINLDMSEDGDNFLAALSVNKTLSPNVWTKITFDDEVQDTAGFYDDSSGEWSPHSLSLCEINILITANGINKNRRVRAYLYRNGSSYKRISIIRSKANNSDLVLNGSVRFTPTTLTNTYSIFVRQEAPSSKDLEAGSTFSGNVLR